MPDTLWGGVILNNTLEVHQIQCSHCSMLATLFPVNISRGPLKQAAVTVTGPLFGTPGSHHTYMHNIQSSPF